MTKILTFGVFDYLHLGHLRLFKQCKKYADYLIVAVQNGEYIEKYKPNAHVRYSTDERVEMLQALRIVDEVKVYDVLNENALNNIDFNILALGEDHQGKRFDDAIQWCKIHNKQVIRLKRTPGISSTAIKEEIK